MACFLCAAACPADCIYIEAAENTDTLRISGGERYAKVYNIDYTRCIFLRVLRGSLPDRMRSRTATASKSPAITPQP